MFLLYLYTLVSYSYRVAFRNFSKDTSDYFKGGGKMLWWMVGATAFMTQFSAWTFTGAAGQAFRNGLSPVVLFLGNALGYFFNYLFLQQKQDK